MSDPHHNKSPILQRLQLLRKLAFFASIKGATSLSLWHFTS